MSKCEPTSALLEFDECIPKVQYMGEGKKEELIYIQFPCFVICSVVLLMQLGWQLRCNNGNITAMSPVSTWEQAWDELDEGECVRVSQKCSSARSKG